MSVRTRRGLTALLVVLLLFTLAFIWGNSLLDREQSTEVSTGLLDFLAPLLDALGLDSEDDHWLRKLAHFAEFALLGAELSLLLMLWDRMKISSMLATSAVCLSVAVVDEFIQLFTGRACQLSDVILDFSGSICAILFVYLLMQVCIRIKT